MESQLPVPEWNGQKKAPSLLVNKPKQVTYLPDALIEWQNLFTDHCLHSSF